MGEESGSPFLKRAILGCSPLLREAYPAPLIKRSILSGIDNSDPDSVILYLDAMNNPGFSGGSVLRYNRADRIPRVLAVVSGRVPEGLMAPKDVILPPVGANAGITISHSIQGAVRAIKDYASGSRR